jgi:tetratricopeptide (TPR) repeat protein
VKDPRCAGIAAVALSLIVTGSAFGLPASAQDPFLDCRPRLAQKPDDYESAYCFYAAAFEHRLWDEGHRVFDALMRDHPDNFWLPLAHGHLERNRVPGADLDTAEAMYRRSANGFQAARHAEGEILARSNLRDILVPRGRVSDATREVDRVIEIAASVTDPLLHARAWSLQASHLLETGGDLGLARRLLKQTERIIFPAGPYRLRRTCLTTLGVVEFRLGRVDEALAVFRRLDAIAKAEGDAQTQANAQYNILNTESMRESFLPMPDGKARLTRLARETLVTSIAATHQVVTVKTRRTLAALLARDRETRDEALQHAETCASLASQIRQPHDEAVCSWLVAMLLYKDAPDRARTAQIRALAASAAANNPVSDAMSASRHMQFSWLTRPPPEAIRDSLAAINAIETLRGLQDGDQNTAQLFSAWTLDYYWLSGQLLQDRQDGDLELAFSITERLRARTLLEARDRSRTASATDAGRVRPASSSPAVIERRAALRDIASIQRTLMDPRLDGNQRQASLDRLEALEAREQEASRQIAIAARDGHRLPSTFASLAVVQSALAANEALLSFQLGIWKTYEGEFGGGSWLVVITRDRRSVYPIPDRSHFAPLVPMFTGLLMRDDGLDVPAAVRLYGEVFSTALADLPPEIDRLILVPDGPLEHLPFDALRANADAKPLAARYELAVVPSATLLVDWRKNPVPPATERALVLADPELNTGVQANAAARQAVLERVASLGRLRYARHESRALVRHLGAVDALVGPLASEHAIKSRNLRDYGILHVAAHALADEAHPDRSAVFLAPGSDDEDGLLQAREISDLNLEGRIVVLSACQTATGAVLSGEGVLSLARAFFEAGAYTVIGTRWPVRDEDAARLFDIFYSELAQGATASEALTRTKTKMIDDGLRSDVWAGIVLLGDGAVRPFPGGVGASSIHSLAILAFVAAAGFLFAARRAIVSREHQSSEM